MKPSFVTTVFVVNTLWHLEWLVFFFSFLANRINCKSIWVFCWQRTFLESMQSKNGGWCVAKSQKKMCNTFFKFSWNVLSFGIFNKWIFTTWTCFLSLGTELLYFNISVGFRQNFIVFIVCFIAVGQNINWWTPNRLVTELYRNLKTNQLYRSLSWFLDK